MTDRETMQQALEALNDCTYDEEGYCLNPDNVDAILALRERLAQPEQEPVVLNGGRLTQYPDGSIGVGTPAKPDQWQGLTEDEKNAMVEWAHPDIIEAIELKLRERNT